MTTTGAENRDPQEAAPISDFETPESPEVKDLQFTNTPNLLTLARMLLVPVVVYLLLLRTQTGDLAAALVFAAASITDFFDGYIARTRGLVTVYGKLMDPLADKFLVACSLIVLQQLGRIHPVVVMLLICREMGITGLRALASAEGVIIAASAAGKWKTAFQMVALGLVIAGDSLWGLPLGRVGEPLLYASLAMSLWSAWSYLVAFFSGLRETRVQKQVQRAAKIAARKARVAAKRAQKQAKAAQRQRARQLREQTRT